MNVPEPDATFWVEIPQPPRPSRTDPEGSWTGLPEIGRASCRERV